MGEIVLNAAERTMKPKQCRKAGFTPGSLYGDGVTDSISVQFETKALEKLIAVHGSSAKVWVQYSDNKRFGIIKEVQRHPVSSKPIHIDVYLVAQDHDVKLRIPILFEGQENLKDGLLQVHKSEVDIFGKANLIPDTVVVDISTMAVGDTVTSANFDLNENLKITDKQDEVYATIMPQRELIEEPEGRAETSTETASEAKA